MSSALIFTICFILFAAALIHTTFGFGYAVVAMPLLALAIDLKVGAPVVAATSVALTVAILVGSWRSVDVKAARRLILATAIGVPLGTLILKSAPAGPVKGFLGLLLMALGGYNLYQPALPVLTRRVWVYGFGFAAGVLAGAYNTAGPPVIIYGTLRRWPPARFRATLQGYFTFAGSFVVISHLAAGLWSFQVLRLSLLAVPVVLIGMLVGMRLNRHISAERFNRLLQAGLIGLGLLLLI